MPGGLTAETVYDSAGRKTHEELDGTGGAVTRSYGYSYYPSNSGTGAAAGLLETESDPRGITVTTTYDPWMRPSSVDTSGTGGAQQSQNTTYGYDNRGMINSVAQGYVSGTAGPSTLVTRGYDGYGHINAETVSVSGSTVSQWYQSWDGAGRRSALNWQLSTQAVGSQYGYSYNGAGLLTGVVNSGSNYTYTYGDNGLLLQRSTPLWAESMIRDNCGRITSNAITSSGTDLSESANYYGNSQMSSYIVSGAGTGAPSDWKFYFYDGRERVTVEPYLLTGTQQYSYYYFDQPNPNPAIAGTEELPAPVPAGSETGLGVRTEQFVTRAAGTLVNTQDNFARVTEDYDQPNNPDDPGTSYAYDDWQYDAAGNTTQRNLSGLGSQTYTWDAWGRMVGMSYTAYGSLQYNATMVYDGFGRRVQTLWQPGSGASSYINYTYDPQVEFQEIGFNDNGTRTWKVYGPDNDGVYGGQQGCGGLECEVNESSSFAYVPLNNQFGDALGTTFFSSLVGSGSYTNYAFQVAMGGYGPEPGTYMGSIGTNLTSEWRGHYSDWTGFVYMGARYYEGRSGKFLSPDPLGHDASMSLYDYCNGDPVNGLDPDGRCGIEGGQTAVGAELPTGITIATGANTELPQPSAHSTVIAEGGVSGTALDPEANPFAGEAPLSSAEPPEQSIPSYSGILSDYELSPQYNADTEQYQQSLLTPDERAFEGAAKGVLMIASMAVGPEDILGADMLDEAIPVAADTTGEAGFYTENGFASNATSGNLGQAGESAIEAATGLSPNTESFTINGRVRIPDFVVASDPVTGLPTQIIESKNVQYQALTLQLRDYAALVGEGGRVDVALPKGAGVSGPLQKAFDDPNNPLFRMDMPW